MANIEEQAKKYAELFNKKDKDGLLALYAPNIVCYQPYSPEPLKGKNAIRQDFEQFFTAFPDVRMKHLNAVSKGDTIFVEWEMTGTHTGPLVAPLGTIQPTNRKVQIRGVEVVKHNDQGQAVEERGYFDLANFMMQLGQLDQQRAA